LYNDARDSDARRPKSRLILAVVGLGIAFFVTGFVLAVTSLAEPSIVSADDGTLKVSDSGGEGSSLSLMLGLVLSLAGVVLATAGPAVFFIHARKDSS